MQVSKTDNRFKTGFSKPITGLPKKPILTSLVDYHHHHYYHHHHHHHHQYRLIGKYTIIPLLTQPQQGYDTKKLALGMRFLTVKLVNSYSWDITFQPGYNAILSRPTIHYSRSKQMEVVVVVVD